MHYDKTDNRKYLTSIERRAFIAAALDAGGEIGTSGLTLAYSGARTSEALATTPRWIDFSAGGIVFRTLKRRRTDVYRTIPVPFDLLDLLNQVHDIRSKPLTEALRDERIWPRCGTTA